MVTLAITPQVLFQFESQETAVLATTGRRMPANGSATFLSASFHRSTIRHPGIIVTANQRIVGTDYPYFLTHSWAQPYRARQHLRLAESETETEFDDFRRIQGDVYSIAGVFFTEHVVKTLRPKLTATDEKLTAALNSFETWDGLVNADSRIAPLVSQMRLAFRSRILTAALGDALVRNYQWSNFDTTLDRIIKDEPADWLPKGFRKLMPIFIVRVTTRLIKNLTRILGADESKWTWGEMAKARFSASAGGCAVNWRAIHNPTVSAERNWRT